MILLVRLKRLIVLVLWIQRMTWLGAALHRLVLVEGSHFIQVRVGWEGGRLLPVLFQILLEAGLLRNNFLLLEKVLLTVVALLL